ncbi:MAG: hypothetical protein H6Q14_302 [Bacteroidetes bacterium]|nr:hypothetical protein [Bacteroidota bacterium]
MEEENMPHKKTGKYIKWFIALILVMLVGLGVAVYHILQKDAQIEDLEQQSDLSKKQLEDEYESLSVQYEGFKFSVKNDSLLQKLENEQTKVRRLMEELKATKASNRAEIGRLTKELGSLRKILKSYVIQIDSLNRTNERLVKENAEITNKYKETNKTLDQVRQEKESLNEKVTLASKLDATGISIRAVNKKGKDQKRIDKVEQIVVSFTITKNITAQPGERIIYVRIMKPDDDVLVKSRANVFTYENKEINYSMKRIVEYGGEETPVTLYWIVEEYLQPGTYRADIFADGSRIGSRSITIEK